MKNALEQELEKSKKQLNTIKEHHQAQFHKLKASLESFQDEFEQLAGESLSESFTQVPFDDTEGLINMIALIKPFISNYFYKQQSIVLSAKESLNEIAIGSQEKMQQLLARIDTLENEKSEIQQSMNAMQSEIKAWMNEKEKAMSRLESEKVAIQKEYTALSDAHTTLAQEFDTANELLGENEARIFDLGNIAS